MANERLWNLHYRVLALTASPSLIDYLTSLIIHPGLQSIKTFYDKQEIMAGPPRKKQRRSEHRNVEEGELPQKKYYRQRAHANPFSDHDLT